jgi:hypothetical protein
MCGQKLKKKTKLKKKKKKKKKGFTLKSNLEFFISFLGDVDYILEA